METKNINLKVLLKEFFDEFKNQKLELSRQQGALWDDLNAQKRQIINIENRMNEVEKIQAFHNRTLFGEEQNGFKGMIKTMEDMNYKINELNKSLTDFMTLFRDKENIKENTIKNINLLYTILSSTGFIYIATTIYKLIKK